MQEGWMEFVIGKYDGFGMDFEDEKCRCLA
jgi:hypothetical protein